MALPVFDNAASASSGANVSSLETASWAISGSERFLVAAAANGAGSPVAATAMRWGGSGGTLLTQRGSTTNVGTFSRLSTWTLTAPTAASQTLYATWSANQDDTVIGGLSYTGVDQTTPLGNGNAPFTNTGTYGATTATISVNATSTVATDMVVDAAFNDAANSSTHSTVVGAGQTSRIELENLFGFHNFQMSEEPGNGGTVTMSWSNTNAGSSDNPWAMHALVIKGSSGSGAVSDSDVGSARNRPGRGPLSLGRFAIAQSMDAYANTPIVTHYTLGAVAGSYSLNGQAVSTRAGRVLTLAQGSYALNGQTVSLRAAFAMPAAQGTYSWNGQAVGLARGLVLGVGSGSYALNGQAARLAAGRVLALAQGSYSLSGQAVGLIYSNEGDKILTAAQGSYALNGQNVQLSRPGQLAAEFGTYTLSGQLAALRASRVILASVGNYALSGQATALRAARALDAEAGAYALNGQAVSVVRGNRVAAELGSYALNGQAVEFLAPPARLLAETGTYVLSGQSADLRRGATGGDSLTAEGMSLELRIDAGGLTLFIA